MFCFKLWYYPISVKIRFLNEIVWVRDLIEFLVEEFRRVFRIVIRVPTLCFPVVWSLESMKVINEHIYIHFRRILILPPIDDIELTVFTLSLVHFRALCRARRSPPISVKFCIAVFDSPLLITPFSVIWWFLVGQMVVYERNTWVDRGCSLFQWCSCFSSSSGPYFPPFFGFWGLSIWYTTRFLSFLDVCGFITEWRPDSGRTCDMCLSLSFYIVLFKKFIIILTRFPVFGYRDPYHDRFVRGICVASRCRYSAGPLLMPP